MSSQKQTPAFRNLSGTNIIELPTRGLDKLEKLLLKDVWSLKKFPSVLGLSNMRSAELTYSQHCCAFAHPEKQDREV